MVSHLDTPKATDAPTWEISPYKSKRRARRMADRQGDSSQESPVCHFFPAPPEHRRNRSRPHHCQKSRMRLPRTRMTRSSGANLETISRISRSSGPCRQAMTSAGSRSEIFTSSARAMRSIQSSDNLRSPRSSFWICALVVPAASARAVNDTPFSRRRMLIRFCMETSVNRSMSQCLLCGQQLICHSCR